MKKRTAWLLILLLCVALAPAAQAQAPLLRAQPLLLAMSQHQPNDRLNIIVQKRTTTEQLETLVETLGGVVTLDLSIINAFAAEVPASAVPTLAAADGVRWISVDAPMVEAGGPDGPVATANLRNIYNSAVRADQVWARGYQGGGIGVAVVDSSLDRYAADFAGRVVDSVWVKTRWTSLSGGYSTRVSITNSYADSFGHGTHVAGVIGGNGAASNGAYIGIAPKVNLINVQVADENGTMSASDVIFALQWILEHRAEHKIRVVNLSLNSAIAEPYQTSAIGAACEILWFNGIVVVTSAGNNGSATLSPPANDPFVITVGAADDKGTVSLADDVVASFSAYGTTGAGIIKPDIVAPGRNIVSLLAPSSTFQYQHPNNIVDENHFVMSGTSVAAPVVSGAIALLLQDEPHLTPDQVKYRLMATANTNWPGYTPTKAGAGYLDVAAALDGTTTQNANTGLNANQLLWSGSDPVAWNSVSWNSVSWNSVSWNSVSWNSVSWNSVSWNSDYWETSPVTVIAEESEETTQGSAGFVSFDPVSLQLPTDPNPWNFDVNSIDFELLNPINTDGEFAITLGTDAQLDWTQVVLINASAADTAAHQPAQETVGAASMTEQLFLPVIYR
ncbi:MAG: S8 family peptidase [Caldilineaceae bacterium]